MYKYFILVCSLLFLQCSAYALEITFPATKDVVVSEEAIFFSGNIDRTERVYINNVQMIPARNRAFCYYVPLKDGQNIFAVTSKDFFGNVETIKYTIIKDSSLKAKYANEFIPDERMYYETTKESVVLRNTPYDAGINRMGYLPKGTKLVIDGVQYQFSRVYLAKDLYGWVKTSDIKKVPVEKPGSETNVEDEKTPSQITDEFVYNPNTILSMGYDKDRQGVYSVKVTNNTPYYLREENNRICFTLYNLSRMGEMYTAEFPMSKFSRYSLALKDGVYDLTIKQPPFNRTTYSNKKVKIVIDAGHGGSEPGAVGCLGHKEKVLNLDIAHKLKRILLMNNFDVYMTRENDTFVSLPDRVRFAKSKDALIFISIHLNSVPISSNPNLNSGTIVFYFNPSAKPLATELANSISKELHTQNNGASQESFAVIRPPEYIGALVELAYLVNPKDVSVYKSKLFAIRSAIGIYNGLVSYLQKSL